MAHDGAGLAIVEETVVQKSPRKQSKDTSSMDSESLEDSFSDKSENEKSPGNKQTKSFRIVNNNSNLVKDKNESLKVSANPMIM